MQREYTYTLLNQFCVKINVEKSDIIVGENVDAMLVSMFGEVAVAA